jgi:hypothetical protein
VASGEVALSSTSVDVDHRPIATAVAAVGLLCTVALWAGAAYYHRRTASVGISATPGSGLPLRVPLRLPKPRSFCPPQLTGHCGLCSASAAHRSHAYHVPEQRLVFEPGKPQHPTACVVPVLPHCAPPHSPCGQGYITTSNFNTSGNVTFRGDTPTLSTSEI